MKKLMLLVITALLVSSPIHAETVQMQPTDFDSLLALVKMGGPYKADVLDLIAPKSYKNELSNAGLTEKAKELEATLQLQEKLRKAEEDGYISFGDKEIEAFLMWKAEHADIEHKTLDQNEEAFFTDTIVRYSVKTEPSYADVEFNWRETPVCNYKGNPPSGILKKIIEENKKGIFDELRIVTVSKEVLAKDPLLIGRINGSEQRFFIAQWGDDVKMEDLFRAKQSSNISVR